MATAASNKDNEKALSELIIINNDRYEGYTKAAEQIKDSDLKALFTQQASMSKKFSEQLRQHVDFKEEAPDRGETTFSGKIYRAWMDIRKALSANDRKAVLSSCEYGEDVALKTYDHVLSEHTGAKPEVLDLVREQRTGIKEGHDKVKQLRDSEKEKSGSSTQKSDQ